jgi:DnaJ domain
MIPHRSISSDGFSLKEMKQLDSAVDTDFPKIYTADLTTTNDEILKGVSKTTQLLLQTQPVSHKQLSVNSTSQTGVKDVTSKNHREQTLYDILGTTPTATKEDLKRRYIIMAKSTHPDAMISQRQSHKSVSTTSCDFSEIAAAYRTLSNPLERKKYDRTLHSTKMIQLMVVLGEICIGTTLTMAEVTSAMLFVALMIVLQPLTARVTNEFFVISSDTDNKSS